MNLLERNIHSQRGGLQFNYNSKFLSHKHMDILKRQRLGWYLFNFSGELLLTNGALYFLPWLTKNVGVSDSWYNLTLVITSGFLIVSGPVLGRFQDRKGHGYYFLILTSILMFVCTLGIHLADRYIDERSLKAVISLIFFGGVMYCYQLALIFYNVMLRNLSLAGDYSKRSGLGVAAGWLGAIIGILAILPFVEGMTPFSQSKGESQAFLPTALLFGFAAVISLTLMRGIRTGPVADQPVSSKSIVAEPSQFLTAPSAKKDKWYLVILNRLSNLRRTLMERKDILYFLIALFLFADAVLTIENNSSNYLDKVMKFSEADRAMLFLLLLVSAAIGALIPAWLHQRVKPKQMLLAILAFWVLILIAISITANQIVFTILFAIVGLLYGSLRNVMRVLYLSLLPPNQTGHYFGFYASFERFATLIGPLVWILTAYISNSLGDDRYRISMLAMAALIVLSCLFLRKLSIVAPDQIAEVRASSD